MCGVKTNIVTAVEIEGQHAGDSKLLPSLTATTAQNFTLNEISADKGYASKNNVEIITKFGATPFIAMKETDKGLGGGAWTRDVPLLQLSQARILEALSSAVECRIYIQHDEAEIWRFAPW